MSVTSGRMPRPSLSAPDVHSYIPRTGHVTADRVTAILAMMRQWTSEAQQGVDTMVPMLQSAGFGQDHIDPSSGLSLIHFAVRSGALGIGNDARAAALVDQLLKNGADAHKRCKYAQLLPIHYAAIFGCSKVIDVLTKQDCDIDALAPKYDGGCGLHLAVASQGIDALRALLRGGANVFVKNDRGNTAYDEAVYILEANRTDDAPEDVLYDADVQQEIVDLLKVAIDDPALRNRFPRSSGLGQQAVGLWIDRSSRLFDGHPFEIRNDGTIGIVSSEPGEFIDGKMQKVHGSLVAISEGNNTPIVFKYHNPPDESLVQEDGDVNESAIVLLRFDQDSKSLQGIQEVDEDDDGEINVGDRVLVNNKKVGTVRYKGETEFSNPGVILYGIQLLNAEGKHNGTIGTKTYFRCRKNHGTFVPRRKLKLLPAEQFEDVKMQRAQPRDTYVKPIKQVSPAPFSISTMAKGSGHSLHAGVATAPENYERRKQKLSPKPARKSNSPKVAHKQGPGLLRLKSPLSESTTAASGVHNKIPVLKSPGRDVDGDGFGVGSTVLLQGSNVMVKYIGEFHKGKGIWIGVAFTGPDAASHGEHDGTVDGKKYFVTKDTSGLLVPASKVTWRGHKVSDLV